MSEVILYDYWRSSAAYRVRIALNLKGIAYRSVPVDLTTGEQRSAEYLAAYPQGLVPALDIDGHRLTQSLAIIDYLDAKVKTPPMVSSDPATRSHTLAQALTIAAEIHPLHNLRVAKYLRKEGGFDEAAVLAWIHRWMGEGLAALEVQAPVRGFFGGDQPNLADVCLVPQFYSARRFGLSLERFPRLVRLDEALRIIPAFAAAAPEAVKPE